MKTATRAAAISLVTGLGALVAALIARGQTPSELEQRALTERIGILHLELDSVVDLPNEAPDETPGQLPRERRLEDVLGAIDAAGRRAGVFAITPLTNTTPAAPGGGDSSSMSDSAEPGPSLQRLTCTVQIDAGFAELVRFLSDIETTHPILRVEGLEVTPHEQFLRARATVAAFGLDEQS